MREGASCQRSAFSRQLLAISLRAGVGSASELEYHLLRARDLKLIKPKDYEELAQRTTEVKRMLTALIQS